MADRESAMLAECRAAIVARRDRAQRAHGAALQAAAAADRVRADAARALVDAERAWTTQMAQGFDPTLGVLLAATMLARAERSDAAARDADRTTARVPATARAWHREDGRCRVIDAELQRQRRRVARRADEIAAGVLADRVCFAWRAR